MVSAAIRLFSIIMIVLLGYFGGNHPGEQSQRQGTDSLPMAKLIPASATMQRAWEVPRNPIEDSILQGSYLGDEIRFGFRLFTNTSHEAPQFSGNALSCSNCHLNAGQREKALPLVGVAGMFPEYNKRAGRLFTIEDRVVECFKRSIDAAKFETVPRAEVEKNPGPTSQSREVLAISAYIAWLSAGYPAGKQIPWRGQNVIPSKNLVPIEKLDPKRGEKLYKERCTNCHGEDGQGVEIGDKKAGPLWGEQSWNDGAGAARVYTLAGMIRYTMPYLDPGSLSDEEAQQIAAFINSKTRPEFPFKNSDYRGETIPSDAVYYKSK